MTSTAKVCITACTTLLALAPAKADENRWWPVQAMPKALVRTENQNEFPAPRIPYQMMAQSVAGLAAKAVNEGRADEMVWVGAGDVDVEDWLARLLKRNPQLEMRGAFAPVTWCAGRLPPSIRTVSPEELVWRIRRKHNAEQTSKLVQEWLP